MTNQLLEREPLPWLVIPAGNQAIGPTQHRVGGTRRTVFTVEIKGMGKKGQKEVTTHPTEKAATLQLAETFFEATTMPSARSMR